LNCSRFNQTAAVCCVALVEISSFATRRLPGRNGSIGIWPSSHLSQGLAEVPQAFTSDRGFDETRRLLGRLEQVVIGGADLAVEAV